MIKEYYAIGLMSGTSLDGLDIAFCKFHVERKRYYFEILCCETHEYTSDWQKKLRFAPQMSAEELRQLDVELGHYFGRKTAEFIKKYDIKPDCVCSHGHTIFHNPSKAYTLQIGEGAALRTHVPCTVIFDFRSADLALGGQGAPLVPIGDAMLFSEYDACINLGGFANISYEKYHKRIAFDICPVNIVLNEYAAFFGKSFDDDGQLAKSGIVTGQLLEKLNKLEFYSKQPPKSLGREWVAENIIPLFEGVPAQDVLATFTRHVSEQIAGEIDKNNLQKVLLSGGGTKNIFLVESIQEKTKTHLIIPSESIIHFKEALIFAFLGVLRLAGENNVLASVTGASKDHSAGSILY